MPATGISCLAFVEVIGRRRDPSPPESTRARIRPRASGSPAARRRPRRPAPARTSRRRRPPPPSGRPLTCFVSSDGKYFCTTCASASASGAYAITLPGTFFVVRGEGGRAGRDVEPGLREHVLHLGRPRPPTRGRRRRPERWPPTAACTRGRVPTSPSGLPSRIAAKMRSADASMRRMPRFAGSGNAGTVRNSAAPVEMPSSWPTRNARSARFRSSSRTRFRMIGLIITGSCASWSGSSSRLITARRNCCCRAIR